VVPGVFDRAGDDELLLQERNNPMTAKITLTLEQDDEYGTDEAMAQTIALLTGGSVLPIGKLVITIACENEDAESYAEDVKLAMARRPAGIEAKVKVTTEEGIERARLATVTPMDKAWSN
jgi:hypothetical protein